MLENSELDRKKCNISELLEFPLLSFCTSADNASKDA